MSRRRSADKREILPDAKYGNLIIAKVINCAMVDGKKSVAEQAVYSALEEASEKLAMQPSDVIETVIEMVRPKVEVRSRRVGGATYQVPTEVRAERSLALAIRWLIGSSRKRRDRKTFATRFAAELVDSHAGRSESVKIRENTHKMAEANRAFAHFNW